MLVGAWENCALPLAAQVNVHTPLISTPGRPTLIAAIKMKMFIIYGPFAKNFMWTWMLFYYMHSLSWKFFFFSFTIFLCLFVFLFPKIIFSDSEGGTCKLNSTMVVFKHINCLGKVSTAHSHSALLVIFHDSVYFFIIFLILFSKLKSIIFIFCLYI